MQADGRPGAAAFVAALPVPVILVDPGDRVAKANIAAEQLLNLSERMMIGQSIDTVLPAAKEARKSEERGFVIYDVELATARGVRVRVDFSEAPVPDHLGWRAIALHPAASTRGLGHSTERAGGARAAVGAAAMLAHEIKNPLSGIRGAAQLLEPCELTALIVTEVDRIAALIDRMQDFSDARPLPLANENIYPLLAHARNLALAGFARGVDIEERFDPSLPPAYINRDAVLQILINLLKNAREAIRGADLPRIVVTTAYRHGIAASTGQGKPRLALPIEICICDTGAGAPAEIVDHMFEAFVSGRRDGQGLGLALVDKLVRDMGGIVQYAREGTPLMTVLRLLLPRGAS